MSGSISKCKCHVYFSAQKESSLTNITNSSQKLSHSTSSSFKNEDINPWHKHSKVIFLLLVWFFSMSFMATESPKKIHHRLLSIDSNETKCKQIKFSHSVQTIPITNHLLTIASLAAYYLPEKYYGEQISLALEGPFLEDVIGRSKHQMIVTLHGGSVSNEVNHRLHRTPLNIFNNKSKLVSRALVLNGVYLYRIIRKWITSH